MKALDYPLLADENIDPEVVNGLVELGKNVRSVLDEGLGGCDDIEIIRHAHRSGRVILTHDSDFGALAVQAAEPYVGIIFIRPGDIRSAVVLSMLAAVESLTAEVRPPFIVVAARKGEAVRVRVRSGRFVGDISVERQPSGRFVGDISVERQPSGRFVGDISVERQPSGRFVGNISVGRPP